MTVPVKVTDEMTPGTVALPHGWGHRGGWQLANRHAGANVNLLAGARPDDLEPLAGMAHLNGIPVRVSPVAAKRRLASRWQRHPDQQRVPRSEVSMSSSPSSSSARSRMLASPRWPGSAEPERIAVDEAVPVVGHAQLHHAVHAAQVDRDRVRVGVAAGVDHRLLHDAEQVAGHLGGQSKRSIVAITSKP